MTTKAPVNVVKLDRFMSVYGKKLEEARNEKPSDYSWDAPELPAVLGRMREAVERGSFNKDGVACRATCKALGIKHTYTAIREFLTTAPLPSPPVETPSNPERWVTISFRAKLKAGVDNETADDYVTETIDGDMRQRSDEDVPFSDTTSCTVRDE